MIEVQGLSKSYHGRLAVEDVSFTAKPSRVTAFLGPNGSGKSTTLRMLLGLATPDAGQSRILGKPYRSLPQPGRHVGVMLDPSAVHGGRSGLETLTLDALTMGVPRDRVRQVLQHVGLTEREARLKVGKYSLGMKQRLGLARSLLGDPAVLILDEPANGLDPSGMRWMRTLLRDFADDGGTVLLSTHLLGEVDAIADDIIILADGRVKKQGRKADLAAEAPLADIFFAATANATREDISA